MLIIILSLFVGVDELEIDDISTGELDPADDIVRMLYCFVRGGSGVEIHYNDVRVACDRCDVAAFFSIRK